MGLALRGVAKQVLARCLACVLCGGKGELVSGVMDCGSALGLWAWWEPGWTSGHVCTVLEGWAELLAVLVVALSSHLCSLSGSSVSVSTPACLLAII